MIRFALDALPASLPAPSLLPSAVQPPFPPPTLHVLIWAEIVCHHPPGTPITSTLPSFFFFKVADPTNPPLVTLRLNARCG